MTKISDDLIIEPLPLAGGARLTGPTGKTVDIQREDIRAAVMVLLQFGPPLPPSPPIEYRYALLDETGELVDRYTSEEIAWKFAATHKGWMVKEQ